MGQPDPAAEADRRWLARRLIGHATRVSTLSNYTQELLLNHFPEAADKIYLTPGALRSDFADYGYVLETGEIALEGPAAQLARDPRVIETYLGAGAGRRET